MRHIFLVLPFVLMSIIMGCQAQTPLESDSEFSSYSTFEEQMLNTESVMEETDSSTDSSEDSDDSDSESTSTVQDSSESKKNILTPTDTKSAGPSLAISDTPPVETKKTPIVSEQPKPVPATPPESKPEEQTPSIPEKEPSNPPKETERMLNTDASIPSADTQPTEPKTAPPIDISQYINYAITCGKDHGLVYDSNATACWDNPIIAGTNDAVVKRDINSLFDWYQIQGFTIFSVWAEERTDGKYDLFIGYA